MDPFEKIYFESIEDKFFKVRRLLQKYDLRQIKKDELIRLIKEPVDYRSEY
jgi:hypothetical protein